MKNLSKLELAHTRAVDSLIDSLGLSEEEALAITQSLTDLVFETLRHFVEEGNDADYVN